MAEMLTVPVAELRSRIFQALREAGADESSATATTKALVQAALLGIDSHGARLVPHYVRMMKAGRINPKPQRKVLKRAAASALLDGDDGLGHATTFEAVTLAGELAKASGVGAVGVVRSSHFGATASYTMAGAEAGFITLVTCNTDMAVALHGGAKWFHGTNPIGVAAPVGGAKPWMLEVATSNMAFNKVAVYKAQGKPIPPDVGADENGEPTTDPDKFRMLLPLGGAAFGHKGAAFAGLATVLSAVLTGATLDPELISMWFAPDNSIPRNLGHFVLAIDPDHFVGRAAYDAAMSHYLTALRAVPPRKGFKILAPGDYEWEVEAQRMKDGLPIDAATAEFLGIKA